MSKVFMQRPLRVLSNIWYAFISGPKTGKPFKVKFESSTLCNLKCVMCPLTSGLTRKRGVLKFENFKKIFDEIRVPYLNLTGLGEPFMNPEIYKIIRYARKKGSLVKIDTNATLLNKENIKRLIYSNPSFISVSIDGMTKKSYESIRKGANFEKVIVNLKNLVSYRNFMKSKTQIQLFFVLQKDNVKDLIPFLKFAESLGVEVVNGTVAISFGTAENKNKREIKKEEIEKVKRDLKIARQQLKIKINIENIDDFLENPDMQEQRLSKKPCFYPWYNPCITWDGYVVPCDLYCDNEIVFGNAFEKPFMKIWNNKKARSFRKQLLKKRIGVCARCCVDETFILDKLGIFYKIPILRNLSYRKF